MLAYAYVHDAIPTQCASQCVSPATMLNGLIEYKHTIETILPHALYHSLYADFLMFAIDRCRSRIYEQCKCVELCMYAITTWFSPHTHITFSNGKFSSVCISCPISLVSAYFDVDFNLVTMILITAPSLCYTTIMIVALIINVYVDYPMLPLVLAFYISVCLLILHCVLILILIIMQFFL